MNSVFMDGRLTADAECKFTQGGKELTKFRIAHNEWKNGAEVAHFYPVQVWKTMPLKKGDAVILEGRLETYEYEKDGERKQMTYIVAFRCSKVQYQKIEDTGGYRSGAPASTPAPRSTPQFEDDIPF